MEMCTLRGPSLAALPLGVCKVGHSVLRGKSNVSMTK